MPPLRLGGRLTVGLERRTPMKRTAGPKADPAATRAWQDRSRKPLPESSPRGRERRARATAAGKVAKARDGGCIVAAMVPEVECWGPLDPQHVIPRGVRPSLADDPANIVAACRGHHQWIEEHPVEARAMGVHGHDGDDLEELAERRRLARGAKGR